MKKDRILWADDEMDLLRPHALFLEEKGYEVTLVVSGQDAIDHTANEKYDIIFLDENMPGLSGLETLAFIKEINPSVPVVMITKNEEESIMNQAIGNKIADYLIKPVNPSQILLTIKKLLHKSNIISETTSVSYRQEFGQITMQIMEANSVEEWEDLYRRLVYWELELHENQNDLSEMLASQRHEANSAFSKYIKKNYLDWINNPDNRPVMSHDLFKKKVFPLLDEEEKVFVIVVDNFRLDQWRVVKDMFNDYFTYEEELYFSILPTATQYARNAIFSGLLPAKIEEMFPELWVDEESEEGKNLNESPLIQTQLSRFRRKEPFTYHKINESSFGERLLQNFSQNFNSQLNILVLNFVDMLSHARTESKMIRELASTEAAYRSLTQSWFKHSMTLDLFKKIAEMGYKIVLTTDHGTVRVKDPVKVIGDKNTTTNLRYKMGKRLDYNPKEVFEITDPAKAGLPAPNVSSSFIFALKEDFFAYPNNFNYYVNYYKHTFQHGGISMEEMMIPLIVMSPK